MHLFGCQLSSCDAPCLPALLSLCCPRLSVTTLPSCTPGVLPIWGKVRNWGLYRRALPGLNAAGVGLIIASVFSLALGALGVSDFKVTSLCIGVIAFTAVDQLKWFEPAVVLGGGVLGIIAWAAGML